MNIVFIVALALILVLCGPYWVRSLTQHERSHHQKKCSLFRGLYVEWWIEQQLSASQSVCQYKGKKSKDNMLSLSLYARVCMCVCKGQRGQYWHAIFWAHGAAAKPGVLHFLQRPPIWWLVSTHCHPDSTSVNMLKPLLLLNSSKPKDEHLFLCSQSREKELELEAMVC